MEGAPRKLGRREVCRGMLAGLPAAGLALGAAGERSVGEAMGGKKGTPQGILQLRLRTQRLAEVREFYREKLEFPIREETRDLVSFQAGSTLLTFVRERKKESRPFYHFAFNIPENKLASAKEWLAERTPLAADGKVFHYPNWNARSIYYWDPGGNLGELIARHSLPNARSGAFAPADVLHASEIGLVVKDVPAAVRMLKDRLGLPMYRSGSEEFEPLGDEHRLLIVVREGRPWMERESGIFPTSATLYGERVGLCELAGHPYAVEMQDGV
jgi:catechol-2,3-dioxygenase